ncbi:sulfotransferase 1A1-like [Ptychodera flava]|uniref:sulfotransferase 1A1-like n=1 Tax=Ptychodera flava TaxID=63121 RepID=UPI00396A1461
MDVKPPFNKTYYYRPNYLLPAIFSRNTIDGVYKNLDIRDDDTFLVTYAKSGTAWTNEMLKAILHVDDLEYLESVEFYKKLATLEFGPADHPDLVEENVFCPKSFIEDFIRDTPSPRVLSTHVLPEYMPTQFFQKKPKTLFVSRNPKDAVVSLYHWHHSIPFLSPCPWELLCEEYIKGNTVCGAVWDFYKKWSMYKQESWMLWLTFEDMKADPKQAIRKIADFIGRPLTEEQLDAVVHATSFKVMKERNERAVNPEFFFPKGHKSGESGKDEETKPKAQWQRKGQVGGWKNTFTVAQSEAFDKVYKEQMKGYEDVMYQF